MKTYHELESERTFKNKLPYPLKEDYYSYYFYKKGDSFGPYSNIEIIKFAQDNGMPVDPILSDNFGIVQTQKAISFLKEYYTVERIENSDSYIAAKNAFNKEEQNIYDLFKDCLFEEFGVTNNPKREKCFSLAWEHGHSSGFNEVYNYFSEFVELIK